MSVNSWGGVNTCNPPHVLTAIFLGQGKMKRAGKKYSVGTYQPKRSFARYATQS